MSAIAANTNVPVSVKCRIGVDDHDSYDELCKDFLYTFSVSMLKGCQVWIQL
jgi:tRNA-dihydrouridine synthase A